MRAPRPRRTRINARRLDEWQGRFGSYRYQVDIARIREWLEQFQQEHQDIAARILDVTEFYGMNRISNAFRSALQTVPGWNADPAQRAGRWMFAGLCVGAGESGDSMLHLFRLANGLKDRSLFCHISEIPTRALGPDDTLVLIDDFVGTGDQVCATWNSGFSEIVAGIGRVFLIVAVARQAGRARISNETTLQVVPAHELTNSDDFFSETCNHFTQDEKARILEYCTRAYKRYPRGWGECGLVLVMQHRCPNDSLPILHHDTRSWLALFPRDG